MNFNIQHQESFSRGQLLLRTFFGWLYITIPHAFCLIFLGMAAGILQFITFWNIMFTGKFPQDIFNFQLNFLRWSTRVNASLLNLMDPYPEFGLEVNQEGMTLDIPYQEEVSRSDVFLRAFLGVLYVGIPHVFCLLFRSIASNILIFISFWIVLFTGKYPASWHEFNVGTLRWSIRVNAYLAYLIHDYPPFSGK